jgi:hypothetical protein
MVDGILADLTGKTSDDLPIPKETWRELCDEGFTPLEAAKAAIRLIFEIGFPGTGKEN